MKKIKSINETMEILADKKLVGQILKSEIERKKGKVVSEKRLLKELKISPRVLPVIVKYKPIQDRQ